MLREKREHRDLNEQINRRDSGSDSDREREREKNREKIQFLSYTIHLLYLSLVWKALVIYTDIMVCV